MVSIVVPVYNMEKYLPRCMKTLLAQTEKNIEIILVDDGSTDASASMCDGYALKHPEYIRVVHKENGGLSSARNVGIEIAKGEYIIFPDPDDWVEPDYIEAFLTVEKKANPDLVCMGHYIDYDSKCMKAHEGQSGKWFNKKEAKCALFIEPCMNGFAWNKLYRLDIIRENNLFFLNDVGVTEDLDFVFRYLEHCEKIYFNPDKRVYHYYQRSDAATGESFSEKKVEAIRTYKKIIEASKQDDEIIVAAREEICNTAINLCWLYKKSKCQDKPLWETVRGHLVENLWCYLNSSKYNKGRKIQALLAWVTPSLYAVLKEKIRNS